MAVNVVPVGGAGCPVKVWVAVAAGFAGIVKLGKFGVGVFRVRTLAAHWCVRVTSNSSVTPL